jgi:hypothetical protein
LFAPVLRALEGVNEGKLVPPMAIAERLIPCREEADTI